MEIPANVEIRATVTRADGTVVELGLIAATYELDPERQAEWDLTGAAEAALRIAAANGDPAALAAVE